MGIACAETADGLDHIYIKGMFLLGQGVAELPQHPAPGQPDGHAALQQREKELTRRLGAPAQGGGAVGAGLPLDDHRVLQPQLPAQTLGEFIVLLQWGVDDDLHHATLPGLFQQPGHGGAGHPQNVCNFLLAQPPLVIEF